jgi:hypothetical protein
MTRTSLERARLVGPREPSPAASADALVIDLRTARHRAEARAGYSTRVIDAQEIARIADEWEGLRLEQPRPDFAQKPSYLLHTYDGDPRHELRAIALYDGDALVGVAPFVLRPTTFDWSLRLRFARRSLLRIPVTEARFPGTHLIAPRSIAVQRLLLEALLEAVGPSELIRFNWVDTSSELWAILHGGPTLGGWIRWRPTSPIMRHEVWLHQTYDEYLRESFGRKARHNMERERRVLDRATGGTLRLDVITKPEQVGQFLDDCEAIQATQSKPVPGAAPITRDSGGYLSRVTWFAEGGWLRSYVVRGDDGPIAALLAYAYDDCLLASTATYSHDWARYSPGKAMWNMVIEDLHDQPEVERLDFGNGDYPYKQQFGNRVLHMGRVHLIQRTPRAMATTAGPFAYWTLRRIGLDLARDNETGRRIQAWARRTLTR